MIPRLQMLLAQEFGRMKASATLQDPVLQLELDEDTPRLSITEGGVEVELEFPDRLSLRRFLRRLTTLRCPDSA